MLKTAQTVTIPNNWRPRPYQQKLWTYLERGGKRAYEIAHRRWGKDDVCLHWAAVSALQRVGNYWHMLPEAAQARKAIWDAINPHTGKRRIDEAFPPSIRKRTVDNEMKIEFVNGSIWQVLGSDNYNSYVGSPPVGVVLSEWALADPAAWAYLMPILEENGGWALFITTPRGRNHAEAFYKMARQTPDWFCEKQPASNTGVFSSEQLDRIRSELTAQYGVDEGESKYEQEYECSFDAALVGAYYGREMNDAETQGRICPVPRETASETFVIFDLGWGDSSALIFAQVVGREPRIIDYHESSNQSVPFYATLIRDKNYGIRRIILPHDGGNGQLATGVSYSRQFSELGFDVTLLPKSSVDAGIKTARTLLDQVWFDKAKTERLVDCLRSYHRAWDDKNKTFHLSPKHDWASHGADAFRYFAQAFYDGVLKPKIIQPQTYHEPVYRGSSGWMG